MKKYILPLVLLILTVGCYKDKTKEGNKPISLIEYTGGISDKTYEVDKWDTLKITPTFTQSMDKEMFFEWQVDGKIVSREENLAYQVDTLGTILCRLRMYNEDGSTFVTFTLNANSPYQKGITIISNHEGRGVMSFKRTDKLITDENPSHTILNCFELENPTYDGGSYAGLCVSSGNLVLVSNGIDNFCMADPYTFKINKLVEAKYSDVKNLGFDDSQLYFMYGDGLLLQYLVGDKAYGNFISQSMSYIGLEKEVKLNPKMGVVYKNSYSTRSVFFDESNEQLIGYGFSGYSAQTVPGYDLTGLDLVATSRCYSRQNCLFLFNEEGTDNMKLYHMAQSSVSLDNCIDFTGTGLLSRNTTIIAPNSVETNVCCSDGNKIYRVNYVANNIPTEPFITLPDSGMEIKQMLFANALTLEEVVDSETNETTMEETTVGAIYVLAYDENADGDLKCKLYCYNYTTQELLWSEEKVAYEPVHMIYKS